MAKIEENEVDETVDVSSCSVSNDVLWVDMGGMVSELVTTSFCASGGVACPAQGLGG